MTELNSNKGVAFAKRKTFWVPALLVAGAVVAAWILVPRTRDNRAVKTQQGATTSGRGEDMSGMSMSAGGTVRLTASQIRQFGVTFDTVRIRPLNIDVRATASIAMDETRIAQITPKFNGFVDRLYVNATGQSVRRGQAVAALFSPDLFAAEQELILAGRLDRSAVQSAVPGIGANSSGLLAAAKQRLRLWDVSDSEINSILRTGRTTRTITLFSPVSGVVTEKNVVQGQSVMAGAPLMTVTDLSTVWAITELRESDARSARIGATVIVEVNAFPGEQIPGRVSYVYPTLMEQSRTIRARVVLANPAGRLKPGMFATVLLSSPQAAALTVPAAALIETGDKTYVFERMKDGALMPHDVKIGRRTSGFVEILSGINAGAMVVTSAQFLLDSESNIGDVMRSMIGQGAGDGSMTDKGADMKGMKMPPSPKR